MNNANSDKNELLKKIENLESKNKILTDELTTLKDSNKLNSQIYKLKEFETIINESPAIIFLWKVDENWPVEFVSENIKQLGYTPEDFLSGKYSWPGITYHDDIPRLESEITTYLEQNIDSFNQQYRLYTKSGDIRWIEDLTRIITNDDGEMTYLQGVVIDITERKKAEEELKGYQEQLEELVEIRTMELRKTNKDLQKALDDVSILSGLIPICAKCKKIRNDQGYWTQVEEFLKAHSEAKFSHGFCPECASIMITEIKNSKKNRDS